MLSLEAEMSSTRIPLFVELTPIQIEGRAEHAEHKREQNEGASKVQ